MMAELVFDAQDGTGESPVWDPVERTLWWTDIPGKRLHRLDAAGKVSTFAMPGRVGCLALRHAGGLVLAMEHGFATWDPMQASPMLGPEPERGLAGHRFNDGRCDRQGRFLAGSMNTAFTGATGQLWRLDGDGTATRLLGGVTVANGLAFSPDGTRMYWACSLAAEVWVCDYDTATGTPHKQNLFLRPDAAPGRPDGAATDAEGCYWSARWMGNCVARFTPGGALDRVIELPVARVTMCAFGGADLRTLYITTAREGAEQEDHEREKLAGGLFAARVDVPGLPEPRAAF